MPSNLARNILGARIRERRRALGLTQAALAREVDVSASYINLIEQNKRGIAGPLLAKVAAALDVPLDSLDGAEERRLHSEVSDVASAPEIAALGVDRSSAGEFIGRFPGWARALAAMARSERKANEAARAMADRLTHDPFLGEAIHRMRTGISAMRSVAEILNDYSDVEPARQQRFFAILHEESSRLSDTGEALAAYFDNVTNTDRVLTPLDEMELLFETHANHFAELEAAADELAETFRDANETAPSLESGRAFAAAAMEDTIRAVLAKGAQLETDVARDRTRAALELYAARALLVPMHRFAPRASELGFDVEALAQSFRVGVDTICHRLAALPGEAEFPTFGYFVANASGAIVEARNISDLVVPRYTSVCPLWVLFRAQQSPEAILRQRAVFPSGARFVFVARARNTGPTGFGKPRHYRTDMLAMSEEDAASTVYAPGSSVASEEVGSACRLCPRPVCPHRVIDPLTG